MSNSLSPLSPSPLLCTCCTPLCTPLEHLLPALFLTSLPLPACPHLPLLTTSLPPRLCTLTSLSLTLTLSGPLLSLSPMKLLTMTICNVYIANVALIEKPGTTPLLSGSPLLSSPRRMASTAQKEKGGEQEALRRL